MGRKRSPLADDFESVVNQLLAKEVGRIYANMSRRILSGVIIRIYQFFSEQEIDAVSVLCYVRHRYAKDAAFFQYPENLR